VKAREFWHSFKLVSHELWVVDATTGQTQAGVTVVEAIVVIAVVEVGVVLAVVEVEVLIHSTVGQMQVQSGTTTGLAFGQGPAFRIGQSRAISLLRVSTVTYFLSVGVQAPEQTLFHKLIATQTRSKG